MFVALITIDEPSLTEVAVGQISLQIVTISRQVFSLTHKDVSRSNGLVRAYEVYSAVT